MEMRRSVVLLASVAFAVFLASGPAVAQTVDTTPPETSITGKPSALSSNVSPSFSFASTESGSSFECKRDDLAYQPCTSPKAYTLLSEGQHTFAVRATDAASNTDPTPAEYTWTIDSLDPKITYTETPGRYDDYTGNWVTNDRSPTWAWTIEDANPDPSSVRCSLYDYTNSRYILNDISCSSPYTLDADLPDGEYEFNVEAQDNADNYGYGGNDIEVDTVAPKVVSATPTGRRVSQYADVKVRFDEGVLESSKRFVNIYKRGSSTPLAVYRYAYGDEEIEIAIKGILKRDTRYTVKVSTEVTDGANNLEAPYSWNFKTR
jgi:hypothetical protein